MIHRELKPDNSVSTELTIRSGLLFRNERIVSSYEMHMDKQRISVSLASMEFKPNGSGTTFVLTEQGVFLDGYDDAGERERGTRELIEQLETYLNK